MMMLMCVLTTVYLIPLNPLDSFSLPYSVFRQREDSCSKAAISFFFQYTPHQWIAMGPSGLYLLRLCSRRGSMKTISRKLDDRNISPRNIHRPKNCLVVIDFPETFVCLNMVLIVLTAYLADFSGFAENWELNV